MFSTTQPRFVPAKFDSEKRGQTWTSRYRTFNIMNSGVLRTRDSVCRLRILKLSLDYSHVSILFSPVGKDGD